MKKILKQKNYQICLESKLKTETLVFLFFTKVISTHQAYLVYMNIAEWNYELRKNAFKSGMNRFEPLEEENAFNEEKIVQLDFDDSISENRRCKKLIGRAAENLLVPNFFALLASLLTYTIIGLTDPFNSIRVYSLFASKFFK